MKLLVNALEMKFNLLCIWIYKLFQMCRDDVMVRYIGRYLTIGVSLRLMKYSG